MKLTQERLKKFLNYNPDTGIFTWKVDRGSAKNGDVAGSEGCYGYLYTQIFGKLYRNNRLAWFYVYGYFPENLVDHIDRNRKNNKISNLREISNQCNIRNSGSWSTNTSGVKGVHWFKPKKLWRAQITVNGKHKFLGDYKEKDEAICARLAGEQCLGWSGCDSNSESYAYVKNLLIDLKEQIPVVFDDIGVNNG